MEVIEVIEVIVEKLENCVENRLLGGGE